MRCTLTRTSFARAQGHNSGVSTVRTVPLASLVSTTHMTSARSHLFKMILQLRHPVFVHVPRSGFPQEHECSTEECTCLPTPNLCL